MQDHREFIRVYWSRRHENETLRNCVRRSIVMLKAIERHPDVWARKPLGGR
jgi:hypothetical protein